jgi:hypothetical protein
LTFLLASSSLAEEPKLYDPLQRQIEGWQVAIDPQLVAADNEATGMQALAALANHLQRIKYILPADRVAVMQKLPIWVELDNAKLANMQYHPDRGWLLAHGHDPRLTKHVHIPRAKELLDRRMWAKHPYVVLHELAHAYHDQVLGFDEPRIKAAFAAAKAAKTYDEVLLYTGKKVRHYGLTNHNEYFAEATEAYLGVNDFYPFVRAELKEHDAGMFALLQQIWGDVP